MFEKTSEQQRNPLLTSKATKLYLSYITVQYAAQLTKGARG